MRMWAPRETIEQGAVRGGALVFSSRILIKAIYFVKTIVLARLLFPEDFGIFGMAVAVVGLTDLFQPGFSAALIHEKENVKKYLSSIWTFNILRNSAFACVILLVAPLAGMYFENETVTLLVRAMALAVFIDGFVNPGTVLFQKELNLKGKAFYDTSYVVAETIVLVVVALLMQSPWVLVIGTIANRVASVIFSFVFHPFRPRFTLDPELLRHLFAFGKWVSLSTILLFFVGKIDVFAIGKILNADALGFFQLAFGLAMLPSVEIARVLGIVVFPYTSIVYADLPRVRAVFAGSARLVFAAIVPTMFGFWIFGESFVRVVYGERWLPIAGIASVLVAVGCLRALEYITNPIALGRGRSDIPTKTLAWQGVVLAGSIFPFIEWFGILGVAHAWLASVLVARLAGFIMLSGEIGSIWRSFAAALVLPLLASSAMYGILILYTRVFPVVDAGTLALGIFVGVVIYGTALFTLDNLFGKNLLNSLRWIRNHS